MSDLKRAVNFYENVLGLEKTGEWPNYATFDVECMHAIERFDADMLPENMLEQILNSSEDCLKWILSLAEADTLDDFVQLAHKISHLCKFATFPCMHASDFFSDLALAAYRRPISFSTHQDLEGSKGVLDVVLSLSDFPFTLSYLYACIKKGKLEG